MNKYVRFLIVFIIVVVMFALTWKNDSPYARGVPVGESVSTFGQTATTPSPVVQGTGGVENTASMRNLILVEFFAGY